MKANAPTLEEAVAMKQKIDKNIHEGETLHWNIVEVQTQNIVGTCGYYRGYDKMSGELGCVLLPAYEWKNRSI